MFSEYTNHILKKEGRSKIWLARKLGITRQALDDRFKKTNWRYEWIRLTAAALDRLDPGGMPFTFTRDAKNYMDSK
jgi:hypothetical protein